MVALLNISGAAATTYDLRSGGGCCCELGAGRVTVCGQNRQSRRRHVIADAREVRLMWSGDDSWS
eukprot:34950-Eustigmatos_ZCMA.PRE.1